MALAHAPDEALELLQEFRARDIGKAILQEHVPRMELVTDDDILAARSRLWEEHRIAVEPAAGAALAAVARIDAALPCVVLCGANSGWRATT